MATTELDVDRLRSELFLSMIRFRGTDPATLSSEEAALLGEHAARIARAALDGIGYFDRTGQVRDPRPTERSGASAGDEG